MFFEVNLGCMKLRLVVEYDPEIKRWAASFPELPGCASAGLTEEEALENIREAIALYLQPDPIELASGAVLQEVVV